MIERFEILNDGPGRWVLVDNESDDPAPVYDTQAAAEAAMLALGLKAMGFERTADKFDEDTGARLTTYTFDLRK